MFGFFKKKKTPPPEEPDQEKKAAVPPPAEVQDRPAPDKEFFAKDPYAVSMKRAALRFLHERGDTFEAEHVFNLINGLIDVEILRLQLETMTWRQAKELMAKSDPAQADRAKNLAIAETAMRIDDFLKVYKNEAIEQMIRSPEAVEPLIKAYIAIDFGAFPLKPEACANLRYAEGLILEELHRRGVVVKGPIENLQEKLHTAIKNHADDGTVTDMSKTLFSMLQNADCLYAATDEDFNNRFVHIAYDGRAEVFTKRELAERFAAHCEKEQLGHTGVREIPKEEIPAFFEELYAMGIHVFRLDNGVLPVDIWLAKVMTPKAASFIDDGHRETRGYLLRELQYGYRIQKNPLEDQQKEQNFKGQMLTMRVNAYRLIGRGVLYALLSGDSKPAVTYYSKAALDKVKADIAQKGLTAKALLAEGDDAYAVHEGLPEMRVVQLPGQTMEQSFVCAFTDYATAAATRERFAAHGVNDKIVVVTWDEIRRAAEKCAGVMIDLPTYGRQLKKEEFAELQKFSVYDKPIVMQFKAPDETE